MRNNPNEDCNHLKLYLSIRQSERAFNHFGKKYIAYTKNPYCTCIRLKESMYSSGLLMTA